MLCMSTVGFVYSKVGGGVIWPKHILKRKNLYIQISLNPQLLVRIKKKQQTVWQKQQQNAWQKQQQIVWQKQHTAWQKQQQTAWQKQKQTTWQKQQTNTSSKTKRKQQQNKISNK